MPGGRPHSKNKAIKTAFSISPEAWDLLKKRVNKSFVVDQLVTNFIHLIKPQKKRRDSVEV